MPHSEFIREVPGSRSAVLMVHGILGTPRHFDPFMPLVPDDWSIYAIILDGHGGKVEDFSRTSMKKWKAQVTARLDGLLDRYDRVLIAAHSMGTLFAIQEAVARPEKLCGLFLLQTPLRPWPKLQYLLYAAVLPFGIVPKGAELMGSDCSVTLTRRLWKYIGWVPRFLELFAECRATQALLGELTVPCYAYQSRHDELVSMRTCRDLQKHPHIQITVLQNSGHFGHTGEDLELLKQEFSGLFEAL